MTHDPAKRRSNKRKHKIDLADCKAAFDAPMLTREDASQEHGEQRLISLGWLASNSRPVSIAWCCRHRPGVIPVSAKNWRSNV